MPRPRGGGGGGWGQIPSESPVLVEIDARVIVDMRRETRVDDHAHHVLYILQAGASFVFSFFFADARLYYLLRGVPQ